jgi:hypothetical protein
MDPVAAGANLALTGGTRYLTAVIARETMTISVLMFTIVAVAVTPTAGQNWIALYDSSGNKLTEGSLDALIGSGGMIECDVPDVIITPGLYFIALLTNAATPPSIGRSSIPMGPGNLGLPVTQKRFAVNGTVQTVMPASLALGANSNNGAGAILVGAR